MMTPSYFQVVTNNVKIV